MPKVIDFYFDFTSPYAYIAAQRIEEAAARHGASVNWMPILLGAMFKVAGTQPLTAYPLKGEYSIHDFNRTARLYGIPFNMPSPFPVGSVGAARAFYWLKDTQPDKAKPFAKAIYKAFFVDNKPISDNAVVAEIGAGLGIDKAALLAAIENPEYKAKLKTINDDAINKHKVFGAPFFIVDGEPFWGADRIDMLERWLEKGGW